MAVAETLAVCVQSGAWATLMQRPVGLDVLACPRCAAQLRLIATSADPRASRRDPCAPATRSGPTDDYAELRGVMIRGRCEILEDEAAVTAAFQTRAEAQANPSPVQPGARASAPKSKCRSRW